MTGSEGKGGEGLGGWREEGKRVGKRDGKGYVF